MFLFFFPDVLVLEIGFQIQLVIKPSEHVPIPFVPSICRPDNGYEESLSIRDISVQLHKNPRAKHRVGGKNLECSVNKKLFLKALTAQEIEY